MNNCIYIGAKLSRIKIKESAFGLKIPGNDLKRIGIRTNHRLKDYTFIPFILLIEKINISYNIIFSHKKVHFSFLCLK